MNTEHRSAFRSLADDDGALADDGALPAHADGRAPEWEGAADSDDANTGTRAAITLLGGLMLAVAVAWVGYVIFAYSRMSLTWSPAEIALVVANACVPLCLIALMWLIMLRSSTRERRNFMAIADRVRFESHNLERRFAHVGAAIDDATARLIEQGNAVDTMGANTTARLEQAVARLRDDTAAIDTLSSQALRDIDLLATRLDSAVAAMPVMEDRIGTLTEKLAAEGERLSDRAMTLDEQLRVASELAETARKQIIDANRSLTAQLADVRQAATGASEELDGLSDIATSRIATAMATARGALEQVSEASAQFEDALRRAHEQTQARVHSLHNDSLSGFNHHSDGIEARLTALEAMLSHQRQLSGDWLNELDSRMNAIASSFAALETEGGERKERLAANMAVLADHSERLGDGLRSTQDDAATLLQRAETILVALDSSLRELDESMPAALTRVDARIATSTTRLGEAMPAIEKMEAMVDGVLSRLEDADRLVKEQARQVAALLDISHAGVSGQTRSLTELHDALQRTTVDLQALGTSVGPAMVDALVRVRETADQAAIRAREAIMSAVPDAAAQLDGAAQNAIEKAVKERIGGQIAHLNQVAEDAVKAAHRATDQLMRQMMTIADTSAEVERRIADARDASNEHSANSLGRLSGQIIEALNSAAIDMVRLLDHDVAEASWAAYLKGDRGIFTRRAVRLADSADTKSILAHYEADRAFAEQVNRYIHDFEAMLRGVLSLADGNSLAVTLLSSDIGKLYVILAQAIERLRRG